MRRLGKTSTAGPAGICKVLRGKGAEAAHAAG